MFDLTELDSVWFPSLNSTIVREPGGLPETHGWHWTERHLHCLWADSGLRPDTLCNSAGEPITVVDPGRWNLEAGPDFLNAVVKVGRRTLKGDVEIHIRPGDWNAHHHMNDPRYANVILHVTWFPVEGDNIPPHIMSVSLRESVLTLRRFSFDSIDLSAYPHAVIPTTQRPCGELMANASPTEIKSLLESAGMSRLRRKSLRMATRLQATGDRYQVFYEEFMAALGYKPNAQGMRRVAEQMPLERLVTGPDFMSRYAMLLGVAGLLPQQDKSTEKSAAQSRHLWDLAWKLGVADSPDRPEWSLGGTRPSNHPRQRLATAAALFKDKITLPDAIGHLPQHDGKAWMESASALITESLKTSAAEAPQPYAGYLKIGEPRINTILANVLIPILSAEDEASPALFHAIPGEAVNEQIKEAAFRLLGRDHNPAIYTSSGLRMQGLLEIWNGFCLSTKSQCADCRLASAMRKSAQNTQTQE